MKINLPDDIGKWFLIKSVDEDGKPWEGKALCLGWPEFPEMCGTGVMEFLCEDKKFGYFVEEDVTDLACEDGKCPYCKR